ncbi:CAP domain-containing protein [Couchioplanes caeruleus]|nr:CAP domain-containing protein [Couchioplanes caeruleus]ROP33989.1 streptogrisin C [Couchioplanes caeruleus]
MQARRIVATVAMVSAAGVAVVLTVPALAGTEARPQRSSGAAQAPGAGTAPADPGPADALLAPMERDLKLTRGDAAQRLGAEAVTSELESRLRTVTGGAFGGAWISSSTGRLTVAVTDSELADDVRATGAEPKLVEQNRGELEAAQSRLDRRAAKAPAQVSGWYVDPSTNSVTLLAHEGAEQKARTWARKAGLGGDAVRVQTVPADFTAMFDLRGGDAFVINRSSRCSVGFPVTTGFVTAGHCGARGATTVASNNAQGTFRVSKFGNSGGNDYAVVDVNRNWTPKPVVATTGGEVPIAGSKEAPVGASVCRTGSTTGTRCGVITARNASLTVSGRAVKGFVITSACAQPGDSGGSLLAGNQAQGVLSGGSGNCSGGRATSVYQPINPVLQTEGLKLVTTGGAVPAPKPTPTQGSTSPKPSSKPTAGGSAVQKAEAEVVRLVNQERARAGCSPVTVDSRLASVARSHSQDMAANRFFSHTNRQGKSPSQRVTAAGYKFRLTGENIAFGQATPAAVMQAWMKSAGHRANILKCGYRNIGVGLAFRNDSGRQVPMWTQEFGATFDR